MLTTATRVSLRGQELVRAAAPMSLSRRGSTTRVAPLGQLPMCQQTLIRIRERLYTIQFAIREGQGGSRLGAHRSRLLWWLQSMRFRATFLRQRMKRLSHTRTPPRFTMLQADQTVRAEPIFASRELALTAPLA